MNPRNGWIPIIPAVVSGGAGRRISAVVVQNFLNHMRALRPTAVGAVLLMVSACATQPQGTLKSTSLEKGVGIGRLTPEQIGAEVRGFADTYVTLLLHISDELYDSDLTPAERAAMNGLIVHTAYGVYTIASDANPVVALFDMVVVVTLTRMSADQTWKRFSDEETVALVRRITRQGEDEVWEIAGHVLTPVEMQDMRELIEKWSISHQDLRSVSYVRFADFAESRRQMHTSDKKVGSLFSLFALDPMANLDPTTRELERSRLLAERAFYFTKRLPILFTATAAQVYFEISSTDEATQVRDSIQTFAEAAQQFATMADRMPAELAERVATERTAAIEQIQQVLASEREALLASLNADQPGVRNLLTELRETIEAGNQLVDSVAVLVPEQSPEATGAQREPIDLAEVHAIVEQTTLAADRLNVLVQSVDRALAPEDLDVRLAQLDLALGRAEARGRSLIDRTFMLAALLVVLIIAGSVGKTLLQRRAGQTRA